MEERVAQKIKLAEVGLPMVLDADGLPVLRPFDVILVRDLAGEVKGPLIVDHVDSESIYYHEPFESYKAWGRRIWRNQWAVELVGRAEPDDSKEAPLEKSDD